ncbi:phosphotransferase enzyme family protein [Hirsutella rhossiliensis]|uniref:Phosphotransferase enzyme family domain-containing protein n=1 Tax=Hirsutella rhossiliensis TaxID=111463 RepID=A0A9P8MZ64_9HYPO|nr:phosphotransferase enzyme family domain-containing protein [Hirsutella rhossiliensis]KAH0961797.1 phosphotransferase enzyme family domain-containing protein [Hirsutella rhossiliensis]
MGTPQDHLPAALSDDQIQALMTSLALPRPTSIEPLQVAAAFHSIYLVHFTGSCAAALRPAQTRNPDGSVTLVLRVAGSHLPRTKTINEVAVMRWVGEHTSIPVPAMVRFDASEDNPVGHEFTLLECAPGRSVDALYPGMSDEAKEALVERLTDVLVELNGHEWSHVGGLRLTHDGAVVPGPVLEDTFWMTPDIAEHWGSGETVATLNPTGPYDSHAALVAAYLGCFARAIDAHVSLAWLRETSPRLRALADHVLLPQETPLSSALASTRLILAHKDLHLANVMATPDGRRLTAVLDWEFAGVVPAPRWDPVRAFLWDGRSSGGGGEEKERMRRLFERALERRGVRPWWLGREDEDAAQRVAEHVWTVVGHARALVEVCPRGQRSDKVDGWRRTLEEALTRLGV